MAHTLQNKVYKIISSIKHGRVQMTLKVKMDKKQISENRVHQRLAISLLFEYFTDERAHSQAMRNKTTNISTSGLYFTTSNESLHQGDTIKINLIIPIEDKRFPENGRISSSGKIVRTEKLPTIDVTTPHRYGVAVTFNSDLILTYPS